MKLASCIFAVLLMITPSYAAEEEIIDLRSVPRIALEEGMSIVIVCATINSVAISKLTQIGESIIDEPSATNRADLTSLYSDLDATLDEILNQSKIGATFIEALVTVHKQDKDTVMKKIETVNDKTRAHLKKKAEDITTYAQFKSKYRPKIQNCKEIWTEWLRSLKQKTEQPS